MLPEATNISLIILALSLSPWMPLYFEIRMIITENRRKYCLRERVSERGWERESGDLSLIKSPSIDRMMMMINKSRRRWK